jgi:hypothetical protein
VTTRGKRVTPKKPKFVAEVSITGHHEDEGRIVGRAKIEQLPGGNCVVHIDASEMTAETLRRGFSIGSFSVPDEEMVNISLQKDLGDAPSKRLES